MKNLIYLFLALLIIACSDDSGNDSCDVANASLVGGTWVTANNEPLSYPSFPTTFIFNEDGTGITSYIYDGETAQRTFIYTSNSSGAELELRETETQEPLIMKIEFLNCDQTEISLQSVLERTWLLNRE